MNLAPPKLTYSPASNSLRTTVVLLLKLLAVVAAKTEAVVPSVAVTVPPVIAAIKVVF